MIERSQIFRCNVCGNIVEILHVGGGELVCCKQPMEQLKEKTEDMGKEKHVPVFENTAAGTRIKVGSLPHPMEEEHHIEWIEIVADDGVYREFLKPGDKPEASFALKKDGSIAREYCSVHGLWKS